MGSITCSKGSFEKHINTFRERHAKCKKCDTKRALNGYYVNKDRV